MYKQNNEECELVYNVSTGEWENFHYIVEIMFDSEEERTLFVEYVKGFPEYKKQFIK